MLRGLWWKALLALAALSAAWWLMVRSGLDPRHLSQDAVRQFVLSFGVWAPVIYLATYGQPFVPMPASIMTIAGGLAFGPVAGTALSLSGATLRACGQLGIARWMGRDAVSKLLKGQVAALDQQIGERSFRTVFWLRMFPCLPYDVQNYALGFSRVKFWPFALATVLGILPWTVAFVYFGDALVDPRRFWIMFAALVAGMAVFALIRYYGGKRCKSMPDPSVRS